MQNNLYDVIIIGAGLSGLYAAFTILDKDPLLDILIIEATDRVGGRISSASLKVNGDTTCKFDLGGHWISSSQRHMMQLVNLLKLTIVPQSNDGLAIGVTNNHIRTYSKHPIIGGIYSRYEIKWFFAMLEEMSSLFKFMTVHNKILADFYDSISMEQFINEKLKTVAAQKIAKNIVLTTCGIESTEISLIFYLLLCNSTFGFTNQYMVNDNGAREYWIEEGAEEIINKLQNIIGKENIVLSEPVIEITQIYTKDLVYLKTATGKKINCSNIICTIPPAQILNINFQPALSRSLKSIFHNMKNGLLIKFIITYEERFWAKQGYSGEIFCCDEGPIRVCHDATRNGHPALMGYIYDSYLDFQGADGLFKEEVIKQLVEYFGENAADPIDYIEKSWRNEMYAAGSPMYCFGLGFVKWSRYSILYPCGRIHWAGAETALEWYGYMNGAIQSGYNAAIEVLYDIRPQSINYNDMTNIIRLSYDLRNRFPNRGPINIYTVLGSLVGGFILYKLIFKNNFFNTVP